MACRSGAHTARTKGHVTGSAAPGCRAAGRRTSGPSTRGYGSRVLQVLVDADNVDPVRTRALLAALDGVASDMVVAGHPRALARVDWPEGATVVEAAGWQ